MTTKTPHPLSFHPEQVAQGNNIINAENAKLDSELAAATAITENYSDTLPPGGTEAAVNAEIRRIALLGLRERTSSNLNFYHEKFAADYYKSESAAALASAEYELAELVKTLPTTKEGFMSRIATLTREALGLSAKARTERLAARDKQEESLIWIETCVESARAAIERFRVLPTPDHFNGISGTIGALKHELSRAATSV